MDLYLTSSTEDSLKYYRFKHQNEFEIIKQLGKGGYSIVYLVKHIETGRKYALKCATKYKNGKDRSKRTRKEIEILSKIKHKNIIRLKGWFEDEDTIYLVLEYVSCGDLSKYYKTFLPDKRELAKIMLQIIKALEYCHEKGIVHRDIKLENILISKRMRIKLTDFGLCEVKESHNTYFYDEVGTPRYTAPELLKRKGYNESVDVWGLGVIFFMLLTGMYPFDGSKKKSIFRRIMEKSINYSKYNFEKEEVHLLKRMLCKNPRYRIYLEDIPEHPWFKHALNHSK